MQECQPQPPGARADIAAVRQGVEPRSRDRTQRFAEFSPDGSGTSITTGEVRSGAMPATSATSGRIRPAPQACCLGDGAPVRRQHQADRGAGHLLYKHVGTRRGVGEFQYTDCVISRAAAAEIAS